MRSCFHVEALSHEQCTLLGHRANLETTYEVLRRVGLAFL